MTLLFERFYIRPVKPPKIGELINGSIIVQIASRNMRNMDFINNV